MDTVKYNNYGVTSFTVQTVNTTRSISYLSLS